MKEKRKRSQFRRFQLLREAFIIVIDEKTQ